MATGTRFNCFTKDLGLGKHIIGTDQFKLFLTNTIPLVTNTVIGNITEAVYTFCSSRNITTTSWLETSGAAKLVLADLTITAGGGSVGPFRWVGVYNDTSATDPLVCFYDRGSSLTLASGESFITDFDQVNGVTVVG